MEELSDGENMNIWKNYTTEDAFVIEKAVKSTKPKTTNPCWRKLCPEDGQDLIGFMTEPIKGIMKDWQKRWEVEGFKIWILEKVKS